jgi:hypothetical protein
LLSTACAGVIVADPRNVEPKPWTCGATSVSLLVAEAESDTICPGQSISAGTEVNPATLEAGDQDWYAFHAHPGDLIEVTTGSIGESELDTVLELRSGCEGALLARDDDGGPGLSSRIAYLVATSGDYRIGVRGFDSSVAGSYRLTLTCGLPSSPPENDRCNDAYALDRCTSGSLEGESFGASDDYCPPDGSCTSYPAHGRDVAYRLDLLSADTVELEYTQRGFDGSIYLISDCGDPASACVSGADGALAEDVESLAWAAETSGTYWLILDAYGEETGGAWKLDYSITCGPNATETTSWGDLKRTFR